MPLSNPHIDSFQLITPAFVYDEGVIIKILTKLKDISTASGCKVLYSLKAFTMIDALRLMAPMLDGFAASSLFEAKLARDLLINKGTVHLTTPGLRLDEINDLAELCDYISFNSLSQWNRFSQRASARASCGVRINPQLSFVADDRYNPCRSNSQLGVALNTLADTLMNCSERFHHLKGLHFHTNCDSLSLEPLLATVEKLDLYLEKALRKLEWINLGGGYYYDEIVELEPFYRAVELLKQKYNLDVFIEPGEAIVGKAGYVVASVVDLFESEGKSIAILDTSVNHMPSIFNYQCQPKVFNSNLSGPYGYLLAGATCLAGDLFGEHRFDAPLEIGSKIIFECMGGYTLVKSNMFNGINLPNIYAVKKEGTVVLKREYTIKDYISRWESI